MYAYCKEVDAKHNAIVRKVHYQTAISSCCHGPRARLWNTHHHRCCLTLSFAPTTVCPNAHAVESKLRYVSIHALHLPPVRAPRHMPLNPYCDMCRFMPYACRLSMPSPLTPPPPGISQLIPRPWPCLQPRPKTPAQMQLARLSVIGHTALAP
jgi:hypothetical protein